MAGRRSGLQPRWHEQRPIQRWSGRRGGRRWRVLRRLISVLLLVGAAVMATWEPSVPIKDQVLAVSRDLPTGAVLTAADIVLTSTNDPPDGVLIGGTDVVGRIVAGPVRSGEILTDARLVPTDGPAAGPDRRAVTVRPADPAMASILTAGVRVAVIGVDSAGMPVVLTADAIVLSLPGSIEESGLGLTSNSTSGSAAPVLLAVLLADADRVTAATLSGDIALRYS